VRLAGPSDYLTAKSPLGVMARSGPVQQMLEAGGNRTVARNGNQVHALENPGIPDREQQIAGNVDPCGRVAIHQVNKLARNDNVRDRLSQAACHRRARQNYDARVYRHLRLHSFAPAQQRFEGETDLHEQEVGVPFPSREIPEAGRCT